MDFSNDTEDPEILSWLGSEIDPTSLQNNIQIRDGGMPLFNEPNGICANI